MNLVYNPWYGWVLLPQPPAQSFDPYAPDPNLTFEQWWTRLQTLTGRMFGAPQDQQPS